MFTRSSSVVVLACVAVLLSVQLRAAEDPAGTWFGLTQVPDQGTDQVTLTITRVDGGLGGKMEDSLQIVSEEELREMRFADGVLTFGFALTDGTAMTMKLTVAGDKMVGEWQTPDGEVGAIAFERKK